MRSKLFIFISVLCIVFSASVFSFASTYSTYNTISQSSSNAQNLISYASNYEGFFDSDFVIAQTGQYEYILAFGELECDSSYLSGDVSIIRYSRGANNQYQYYFTSDSDFHLSINHGVVSSLPEVGSSSSLYSQLNFYHYAKYLLIVVVALCFARLWVRR